MITEAFYKVPPGYVDRLVSGKIKLSEFFHHAEEVVVFLVDDRQTISRLVARTELEARRLGISDLTDTVAVLYTVPMTYIWKKGRRWTYVTGAD